MRTLTKDSLKQPRIGDLLGQGGQRLSALGGGSLCVRLVALLQSAEQVAERSLPAVRTSSAALTRWLSCDIDTSRVRATAKAAAVALGTAATASAALAASVASYGYVKADDAYFQRAVSAGRATAIFDSGDRLAGVLLPPDLKGDDKLNKAYVPLDGPIPEVWANAVIYMEDRDFGSWRPCQVSWLGMVIRPILSGGAAGGSSISMQVARNLAERHDRTLMGKLREIGEACASVSWLKAQGKGSQELLRIYAEQVPLIQGNGVLLGIEGAAWVLFKRPASQLTAGQQLLLAAATKRPYPLLTAEALETPCLRARQVPFNELVAAGVKESAAKSRRLWCKNIERARRAAPHVLQADQLQTALAEISEVEKVGFDLSGAEWKSVDQRRLGNLALRTTVLLPEVALAVLKKDAEQRKPTRTGEISRVSIRVNSAEQVVFAREFGGALAEADLRGRDRLCAGFLTPLTSNSRSPACPVASSHGAESRALVLALRADLQTGALRTAYSSPGFEIDAPAQVGSLAKIPLALAAVLAGLDPEDRFCPLAARIDGRQLARSNQASRHGLSEVQCKDRANLITLREASATSDNLAWLKAAEKIGEERIREAMQFMGWSIPRHNDSSLGREVDQAASYATAFGSVVESPRSVVNGVARVAALAYGLPLPSPLHVLNGLESSGEAVLPHLALSPAAQASLRVLLEAPVQHPRGTLTFIGAKHDGWIAGKTGTTLAARTASGERATAAKWAVFINPTKKQVALSLLSGPSFKEPIGPPRMSTRSFKGIYDATLLEPN